MSVCKVLVEAEKSGMPPIQILAVISKASGRLIACLDPFTVTPQAAMKVVADNIEMGNQEMLKHLLSTKN
jgi:hypothetical protein